jgi:hypothetical protein
MVYSLLNVTASFPCLIGCIIVEYNILTGIGIDMIIQHLADDSIGKCFKGLIAAVKIVHDVSFVVDDA